MDVFLAINFNLHNKYTNNWYYHKIAIPDFKRKHCNQGSEALRRIMLQFCG
jgi:hypothetical protein